STCQIRAETFRFDRKRPPGRAACPNGSHTNLQSVRDRWSKPQPLRRRSEFLRSSVSLAVAEKSIARLRIVGRSASRRCCLRWHITSLQVLEDFFVARRQNSLLNAQDGCSKKAFAGTFVFRAVVSSCQMEAKHRTLRILCNELLQNRDRLVCMVVDHVDRS